MKASYKLTAEQEREAARVEDLIVAAARAEAGQIARLPASRSNEELFGQTEFEVRDHVHRIGARAFEAVLDERKKGGASVPPRRARRVAIDGNSCNTGPAV